MVINVFDTESRFIKFRGCWRISLLLPRKSENSTKRSKCKILVGMLHALVSAALEVEESIILGRFIKSTILPFHEAYLNTPNVNCPILASFLGCRRLKTVVMTPEQVVLRGVWSCFALGSDSKEHTLLVFYWALCFEAQPRKKVFRFWKRTVPNATNPHSHKVPAESFLPFLCAITVAHLGYDVKLN